MGVNESAISHGYIGEEEAEMISQKSHFTKKEIYILASKYREISHDSKISVSALMQVLKIPNESIGNIMYRIIDTDGSGSISFPEFVEGLNKIHPDAPFEDKVKLCFNAYDVDNGGSVSKNEIKDVISISLENNKYLEMSEAQIDELVSGLINMYNKSGTGELDYKEFYNMVAVAPGVIEVFNLDLASVFNTEEQV